MHKGVTVTGVTNCYGGTPVTVSGPSHAPKIFIDLTLKPVISKPDYEHF